MDNKIIKLSGGGEQRSNRIASGDYTSTITNVPYGTTFSASIVSTNENYNPGNLNMTSGTVVGDTTIQASAATLKTQNGRPAQWNKLHVNQGYNYGCTGWDPNNGGISPKKPFSSFVLIYHRTSYNAGDSGLTYGSEYDGLAFAIDSSAQSKYNACTKVHVRIDNAPLRLDSSNTWAAGSVDFDILKSEVKNYSNRNCTVSYMIESNSNYVTNVYDGRAEEKWWNSLTNVLSYSVYNNWNLKFTFTFQ